MRKANYALHWTILLSFTFGSLAAANAQVVFSDSMNYADNAAIQAAWSGGLGSSANVDSTIDPAPTPIAGLHPTPASGSFMSLGNGVRFRDLGTTLTTSWTLDVKMLSTSYGRVDNIFLLNAAGTQGYGILWNTTNVNQNIGNGVVSIRSFNNSTYTDWSTFGIGTQLGGAPNSAHAVTGYAVTAAPDNNQNNATYDTSNWQDFLDLQLSWNSSTGQLTLLAGGVQVSQVTDTNFSSFSRVYVRGNTSGYFDEIVVTVPEPTAGALLLIGGICLAGARRRLARRTGLSA